MQVTPPNDVLHVSMFRNAFDTTPIVRTFTWQQLKDGWASTRRTADKESRKRDVGLMSPARFDPPHRAKDNVVEISVLILDVDIGVSADQILDKLKGLDVFVVETFQSTPEAPRWRVLIRLVRPIPGEEYDEAWARVNQKLGGWLDPATKDSSRMLFLTCAPPDAPRRRHFMRIGDALDWRELPALRKPKPRVRTGSTQPGRHEDRRAAGMLNKWAIELSDTVPGSRRARLLQVAAAAGGLVANGLLDAHNARQALLAACDVNGLTLPPNAGGDGEEATERALSDALEHGEQQPWMPADFGDRQDWVDHKDGSPRLGRRNGHVTREVLEEPDVEPAPLPEIPVFPLDILSPLWGEFASTTSLPTALSIGAGLGVATIAIGGESVVEIDAGRYQRAVLWIPLIAPAATGKNGAIDRARGVMDRRYKNERTGLQSPTARAIPFSVDPETVEAFLVDMAQVEEETGTGALAVVTGELRTLLEGMGQYKRAGNSHDKGVMLDLFSAGAPMTYRRRGDGKSKHNKIDLYIEKPTACVLGGLVPQSVDLLGPSHGDGMRSRWLPFLADAVGPDAIERDDGVPFAWNERIGQLLDLRATRRTWTIRGEARELFDLILARWRKEAFWPGQSSTVKALLLRGAVFLSRLSLVLAEFENPGQGGEIPAWLIEVAGGIVRFCVKCWHALGEDNSKGMTQADTMVNVMVRRELIPLLEALRHGEGRILQRDLQRRRKPTGDPKVFKAVIDAYAAQFGGEAVVRHEKVGRAIQIWLYPPQRGSETIESDADAG